jgi:hypothetical protein
MFIPAPNPVVACGIVLAVICLVVLEVGRWKFKSSTRICASALDFALDNFDALSGRPGFITVDSLYAASKQFPERWSELRFLMDHLSEIGRPINKVEMVTYSGMGLGCPTVVDIYAASRAELRSARATVSPILGIVRITHN